MIDRRPDDRLDDSWHRSEFLLRCFANKVRSTTGSSDAAASTALAVSRPCHVPSLFPARPVAGACATSVCAKMEKMSLLATLVHVLLVMYVNVCIQVLLVMYVNVSIQVLLVMYVNVFLRSHTLFTCCARIPLSDPNM